MSQSILEKTAVLMEKARVFIVDATQKLPPVKQKEGFKLVSELHEQVQAINKQKPKYPTANKRFI